MKSLSLYRGEPTWWDRHQFLQGLTETVMVIVGLVPFVLVVFSGVIWPGLLDWAFSHPAWEAICLEYGALALALGWGFVWINAAINLNI